MTAPSLFRRNVEFEIVDMTAADCAEASSLHETGFSRAWSDGEIQALLAQEPVFGFMARQPGKRAVPGGFVLARLVEGEAEILTIAVLPKHRQSGIGWRLMGAVLRRLRSEGAESLFLEVDEGNEAALALYRKIGFSKVSERAAYYDNRSGAKTAALVMRLDLG
ncbi:GNAT family N-acetyltransferase [Hoeflea sp.]|uniref:GNAT family N-acetyltransferase n=1 Tax=Hoeflea sp. TaxID=1940281 RepID=UPI003B01FF9A